MRLHRFLFIALATVLFLFSPACKTGNKTSKSAMSEAFPFHLVAKKELGDRFMVEFNETGNFVLCRSEFLPDPSVSHYTVKFFIYDVERGEIIYQDVVPRGEVEWHNNQEIRISSVPGIIMPDAEVISNTYLYHIVTGKKKTLGSTEKF
jgi:hypothetical protein